MTSPDPSIDGGTIISLSLTMLVSFSVNVMTIYGVFTKKIAWIVPFFILYMGFIIESFLAWVWMATSIRNPDILCIKSKSLSKVEGSFYLYHLYALEYF